MAIKVAAHTTGGPIMSSDGQPTIARTETARPLALDQSDAALVVVKAPKQRQDRNQRVDNTKRADGPEHAHLIRLLRARLKWRWHRLRPKVRSGIEECER